MKKKYFTGPFEPMCKLFLAEKRATGVAYASGEKRLRQFDDFCKDYTIENYVITEELMMDYCARRPNESDNARRDRLYVVASFAKFLVRQGYDSYILHELPKRRSSHKPYIFTKDELRAFFERLDTIKPSNHSTGYMVFPILFRVLYGCGLRIHEALLLQKCDVDVEKGILHIRRGKNDRERITPMSASLTSACQNFIDSAHNDTPDDAAFFFAKSRVAYTRSAVNRQFRNLLWDIGIPYLGSKAGPRVHDVRHTFICHNMQRWAEQGIPIHSKLSILSKYVGHTSVSATQWYLRLTAEVFPHIREICERELSGIYNGILDEPLDFGDGEDGEDFE